MTLIACIPHHSLKLGQSGRGQLGRLLKLTCVLFAILLPVSRKSRKLFGPEKPFLKLRLANSVKLVFSYVVKGRKIKITAKFRALRRLRFEDTFHPK